MTKYRVTCAACGGEGVSDGECSCGEDTCCCLYPEPPDCPECHGEGFVIVSELTDDNYEDAIPIPE